ncbi:gamma-glutamyl-gamma-aminobutyrate hydrolase family protein [Candidatus Woesearchaeota archaeon]|nr:gamma-glutamyl-gamma-aminobutyrate hydrolase family protein [Candidatus Woesearchaeota archaeon]
MAKPFIGVTPRIKHKSGLYTIIQEDMDYVEKKGGTPLVLQPVIKKSKDYASGIDGLLILGHLGDIHPSFYKEKMYYDKGFVEDSIVNFEVSMIMEMLALDKPVLGICHGCQVLNIGFDGKLYQFLPKDIGEMVCHQKDEDVQHYINVKRDTLLYKILGEDSIKVNSSHHQGIKKLGHGLKASAFSPDGLCEAVEYESANFMLGVQWHPERWKKKSSNKIFKAFIDACKGKF